MITIWAVGNVLTLGLLLYLITRLDLEEEAARPEVS